MDTGTVQTVIPPNRTAVLLNLLMIGAVLAAMYWLPLRKPPHPEILLALFGLFVVYLMWPSITTLFTGVAVVLTDRGIINYTGGVTFVAWHEIEDACIGSPWGRKQVELKLRDQETVLRRIPSLRGWSAREYVHKYGGKPTIFAAFAKGGAEALLSAIQTRLEANRDAV